MDDLLEFKIPSSYVSAIINADSSGLSDEDDEELNEFINDVVETYGNANFMLGEESDESYFDTDNDINNLGGDVTILYLQPTKEYSFGGGVALGGILGGYLGYKIGRSRPQKQGFETEKKIGRKIKETAKDLRSKKKPQTMAVGGKVIYEDWNPSYPLESEKFTSDEIDDIKSMVDKLVNEGLIGKVFSSVTQDNLIDSNPYLRISIEARMSDEQMELIVHKIKDSNEFSFVVNIDIRYFDSDADDTYSQVEYQDTLNVKKYEDLKKVIKAIMKNIPNLIDEQDEILEVYKVENDPNELYGAFADGGKVYEDETYMYIDRTDDGEIGVFEEETQELVKGNFESFDEADNWVNENNYVVSYRTDEEYGNFDDDYAKGGKLKKTPIAIQRRVDEINRLLPLVNESDELAGGYFGSTMYSYVILTKPIEIKNQFVYIYSDPFHYPFEQRYNMNNKDEFSVNGLPALKYDLAIILKAFKKVLKDEDIVELPKQNPNNPNRKFAEGGMVVVKGIDKDGGEFYREFDSYEDALEEISRPHFNHLDRDSIRYYDEYNQMIFAEGGEVAKPRLKRGDSVYIYGKTWFQRSYGNTYHITKVYVNDKVIGISPIEYGYGEQYVQTGLDILWKHYKKPYKWKDNSPLWKLRELGIKFTTEETEVSRERDLVHSDYAEGGVTPKGISFLVNDLGMG